MIERQQAAVSVAEGGAVYGDDGSKRSLAFGRSSYLSWGMRCRCRSAGWISPDTVRNTESGSLCLEAGWSDRSH